MGASRRSRAFLAILATVVTAAATMPSVSASAAPGTGPQVSNAGRHDRSSPLRGLKADAGSTPAAVHAKSTGREDRGQTSTPGSPGAPGTAAPNLLNSFEGVGDGFTGPQGTYRTGVAPSDNNLAAGPNHVMEIVNSDFAVFNKSGGVLYGPVPNNTLWAGFGGSCQTQNNGDGTVEYDAAADRWVVTQLEVAVQPFQLCVAVSAGGDPTGSWFRYAFPETNFPDYPKVAVWPDGYYVTFNQFNASGNQFLGAMSCALDRNSMLTGASATQQCFDMGTANGSVLPADLSGTTQPPAGAPNYQIELGSNQLLFFKFHVDWATPANSTLTGPTSLATQAFSEACNGGSCIPQAGTTQQLDTLADRLMFRFTYRNFGDHEALLVNHSVSAGSSAGVRWYELRSPSAPVIFQQGTYAPDTNYRWMGAVGIDRSGDVGLGFSVSGSSIHPGVHYTGRFASDPLGTMSNTDGVIIDGNGSQTPNLSRWGDYSGMSVDPADDCTFWYVNQYIAANGNFNWHTRIGSFKFSGCGQTSDFSISVSPASGSTSQGGSVSTTVSTTTTAGTPTTVTLSASGLPASATANFNPGSVTSGGQSLLTVSTGLGTPAGSYPLTITGTSASGSHSTTYTLQVTSGTSGIVNGGFETGDFGGWSRSGTTSISTTAHSGAYAGQVGASTATNGDSSVSQTFNVPSGMGALSFWYRISCHDSVNYDWATVTLLDNTTGVSATPLAKTCTNNATWVRVMTGVTAGDNYTLTLTSHDDGLASDPTYTLYDDVALSAAGVVNGGFELGNFTGWTPSGAASAISTTAHSGAYAAQLGSTAATNGDSSVAQTFIAPAGSTSLSFWYRMTCPDTVTYDWATATLRDNTAGTTTTPLPKTCSNTGAWVQVTAPATPLHSYTLTLASHDDNFAGDPTYTLFDDVTAVVPSTDDFSISTTPASGSVNQGDSTTATVSTQVTQGNPQSVSLSCSGLPSGASCTFNPSSVNSGGSSVLTLATAGSTPAGTYTVTITGTGTSVTHTASYSLTVVANDFSISASPGSGSANQGDSATTSVNTTLTSGAAQNIALSCTGLPSGATCSFNPPSVSSGGSSTLTLSTANTTPAGQYSITITGTGSFVTHSTTYTLSVVANDFSISISPASGSVNAGGSTTATVSTALTSGAAQSIALAAAGMPSGGSASFDPTSVTSGGSSALTLSTAPGTPAGQYTITITGTGTFATHSTTFTLTVLGDDFSISVNPASGSITQGTSTSATVTTVVTNGNSQSLTLTAAGLPTGATANFNPSTISSGGSSTVTLSAANTTPAGTYTVTITGTGSAATHSASYQLTVILNDFSISASPGSGSVKQGGSTATSVNTGVTSGDPQSVTLSASGLPAGAGASFSPSTITSGGASTLTISTASSTPTGTFTVTITGTGTSVTHSTTFSLTVTSSGGGIINGGFESGDFTGWTRGGAVTGISGAAHSGSYAAQLGSTSPSNGDSTLSQTFTVPGGMGVLSFWYRVTCPDSVLYDWATATLRDNTTGTLTTPLARTCTTAGSWTLVMAPVNPGDTYTLTLFSHDDNFAGDATYTLYDDVALSAAGIANGGFETGDLTGWTHSGAATSVVTTAHSGSYAALLGATTATNGDSTLSQSFVAPTGTTSLSLWYANRCPDTVTYDWIVITLKDNTSGTTTTLVPKTCSAVYVWTNVTGAVTAGHWYTLTITNHDDNYSADPTYSLSDDVTMS